MPHYGTHRSFMIDVEVPSTMSGYSDEYIQGIIFRAIMMGVAVARDAVEHDPVTDKKLEDLLKISIGSPIRLYNKGIANG